MKQEKTEFHPYGEFIPPRAKIMVVGSFPIGKFTDPARRCEINLEEEVDFFYGGKHNVFWRYLSEALNEQSNLTDRRALEEMLTRHGIAMGDVISSCCRLDGQASDSKLRSIEFNQSLKDKLHRHEIKRLVFTSQMVKRWFAVKIDRLEEYQVVTLISPSRQGLRSIGQMSEFRKWQAGDEKKTASQFRKIYNIGLLRAALSMKA